MKVYDKKRKSKYKIFLRILYLFAFLSLFIQNAIYFYQNGLDENFLWYFVFTFVLALPLGFRKLGLSLPIEVEKYAYIKRVYTNLEMSKEIKRKFLRAGMELSYSKNTFAYVDDESVFEGDSLEKLYDKIYLARGKQDNFLRNLKVNLVFYLLLNFCYITLEIAAFPIITNIYLLFVVKGYFFVVHSFLYKRMSFDVDIGRRRPRERSVLLSKEEWFLLLLQGFLFYIGLMIPYMYLMISAGDVYVVGGIFYTMYLLMNVFCVLVVFSEKSLIFNFFKAIQDWKMILFFLFSFLVIFFINCVGVFDLVWIGWKNFIGCLCFAFFFNLVFEITKLARWLSIGGKKNEFKNYKKNRRG